MFSLFKNLLEGRSPRWEKVRKFHLKEFPACAACARVDKKNEVHHVIPFHVDPEKELDLTNLLTLCERHHLVFGHFDNYRTYNPKVRESAANYLAEKNQNVRSFRRWRPKISQQYTEA